MFYKVTKNQNDFNSMTIESYKKSLKDIKEEIKSKLQCYEKAGFNINGKWAISLLDDNVQPKQIKKFIGYLAF